MQECVPGDTVKIDSTNIVARMQTPIVPTMGSAYLDYWYFFIPTRLVWENFKEFMGENKNAAWSNNLPVRRIPVINTSAAGNAVVHGSSADYLGLPLGQYGNISAIPFRSIRQVWNDFFRSTAIDDPLLINTGDTEPNYSVGYQNFDLLPVNKFPDYFTSCLPSPQFGEAVSIGLLGDTLPVLPGGLNDEEMIKAANNLVYYSRDLYSDATIPEYFDMTLSSSGVGQGLDDGHYLKPGVNDGSGPHSLGETMHYGLIPANLSVDLRNIGMVTINDLRVAFRIQKYKEAQARGGSRYTEILQSIWSVTSPDARLQRSEYIGGDRALISMQQVLKTSGGESDPEPQGFASGFSKTATKGGSVTYAVPEHGLVMGFCTVRVVHSYQQGVERYWKKRDVFDFYNPLLAHIGETPVYDYEIYATTQNSGEDPSVFGYQEAWADYRTKRSYVSGEIRTLPAGIEDFSSMDVYSYADYYSSKPTLSPSWLKEDPSLLERTLAVSMDLADQFIADIFVDLTMIRIMPAYSIPGLIDHA